MDKTAFYLLFQGAKKAYRFRTRNIWQQKFLAIHFSNFSCMFLNPNIFFQFEFKFFKFIESEKPPGTSEKAICSQILFWPFTVWINCSSDLKNSRTSASNLLITRTICSHSRSEQFGQQNPKSTNKSYQSKTDFTVGTLIVALRHFATGREKTCSNGTRP